MRIGIKRYLRQLLRNRNTVAGQNVFFNRPVNYELEQKQAEIRILSLNAVPEIRDQSGPRIYKDSFFATIEIAYAPDGDDYDAGEEIFEGIVAEVQDAIESDQYLNDPAISEAAGVGLSIEDTTIESIDYRTEADGGTAIYIGSISYKIVYNRTVGAKSAGLRDFNELNTEMFPADGTDATPSVDSREEF